MRPISGGLAAGLQEINIPGLHDGSGSVENELNSSIIAMLSDSGRAKPGWTRFVSASALFKVL
jgi:hypothetical protein